MRYAIVRSPASLILLVVLACPALVTADAHYDLTPPNVELVKLSFKLNELDYTVQAPQGSAIQVNSTGAFVTKGKDFGFAIELGRKRFAADKRAWKHNAGNYTARDFAIDKKDQILVESTAAGDARFAAVASVEVPYISLTVRSAREGTTDVDAQTLGNCLLVLKCAATIALQSPPPADPVALLEWLKADVRKDDDGKVQSLALPASITDAALPLLERFPTLKSLTIVSANLTDQAFIELAGMQNLEELGLVADSISELQLAHIGKIPNLTTLSLGASIGVADIAEAGLADLQGLANLQTLDLSNTRAGDVALSCLKEMRSLKVLRLGSTLATDKREGPQRAKISTLSDEGLAHLAKLTNLETLSLRRTDITGVGMKYLADLMRLHNLELNDTFVSDEGLEQIGKIESLQLLQIARTNITGEGLKHLANLEELKELDLTDTAVDDQGLNHLSAMIALESLQLRRTHITDEGLIHLDALKNLETLNLSETKVTDAGLPRLYRLKKLQSLYTSDTAVTQDALDKLDKVREMP